jgi:hypothetical protein
VFVRLSKWGFFLSNSRSSDTFVLSLCIF